MITVKRSDNDFLFSHGTSKKKLTVEKALEELKYARMRGDSRFRSIIQMEENTPNGHWSFKVTRRKITGRSPILTWVFEGPEEEITQLLAAF